MGVFNKFDDGACACAEIVEFLQIGLSRKTDFPSYKISYLAVEILLDNHLRRKFVLKVREHSGEDCDLSVLAGHGGGLRVKLLEKVFARHSDGCGVLLFGLRLIVERKGERSGFGSEIHAPFLENVVIRKVGFGGCRSYFFRFFADGFSRLCDGFGRLLLPDFDKFLDGFTTLGRRTVGVWNRDIVTAVEIDFALAVNHTLRRPRPCTANR